MAIAAMARDVFRMNCLPEQRGSIDMVNRMFSGSFLIRAMQPLDPDLHKRLACSLWSSVPAMELMMIFPPE
jgi:hypothetical protein